jgi:CheY-like chemotaxis protein
VVEAEDGFAALDRLRTTQVGVIILDVRMPVMDGYQLLDKLDDLPPVLPMTACGWNAETAARRTKIFEFLRKSTEPTDLVAIVARALEP